MKSQLYIFGAEISSSIKAVRCVVRACVVMTALSMCWMAHSVFALWSSCVVHMSSYASAWVVWPFWLGNSSKRHFTPEMAFFSVVTFIIFVCFVEFIFLLSVTIGRQCHVSVPNNEKNPLQPRSVCRWDRCECPDFDRQHSYKHTYCTCICLDLTLFPFPTSSGTSLRVEIQNSKWKLSGYVMGETLISDRWLQNTSCVGGRSVWWRQRSRMWIQTCRFRVVKWT